MNRSFNKFGKRYFRAAICELHPGEEFVQSHLAYTPSQMMELAAQGIPVSTQTAAFASSFDEGYRTLDFTPLPEHQRGMDIAQLWEISKDAHARISGVIKKAKKIGGDNG